MRARNLLFLVLFSVSIFGGSNSYAQSEQKAYFGFGGGIDYGGLGMRGEYLAAKSLGIFVGFGYNLVDPAFNAGLSVKLLPGRKVVPLIVGTYGYNAVIKLKYGDGNSVGWTYYGPSFGAGCEFLDRNGKNKFLLELFFPVRNSDFHNKYDELKAQGVDFNPDILPVTFTIGYNFSVSSKAKK
ncbi:MAG TPA: hypothetical protein VI385_16190 [Flavisolibacter sp.]